MQYDLPIHPVVLIGVVCAAIAIIAIMGALLSSGRRARVVLIAAAVIFAVPPALVGLAMYPWLYDSRYSTYRTLYREIQPGMTRDQVEHLLDRHYPESGALARPLIIRDTRDGLGFFMNPAPYTEPDIEGIFLTMSERRVVKKEYSPD